MCYHQISIKEIKYFELVVKMWPTKFATDTEVNYLPFFYITDTPQLIKAKGNCFCWGLPDYFLFQGYNWFLTGNR